MRVTIGVASAGRTASLLRLLPHLRRQASAAPPDWDVDIVVCDNNLSPQIADAVRAEAVCARSDFLTGIRVVHEPQPGLYHARTAIFHAAQHSRVLACLDDDEIPHPAWLHAGVSTLIESDAAAVTGPIIPAYPSWPSPEVSSWALFDRRHHAGGTCVSAFSHANVFLNVPFFRGHRLGYDPRFNGCGGEDSALSADMIAAGGRLVWDPTTVVYELVDPARMSTSWARDRVRRHGAIARELAADGLEARMSGVARWVWGAGVGLWAVARGDRVALGRAARLRARGRGLLTGLGATDDHVYSTGPIPPPSRGEKPDLPLVIRKASSSGVQAWQPTSQD